MIKHIHKLNLTQDQLTKLAAAADLHHKMSNIRFKIGPTTDQSVVIITTQGRHLSENYAGAKELVTLTKDLFKQFVKQPTLHTHPHVYTPRS